MRPEDDREDGLEAALQKWQDCAKDGAVPYRDAALCGCWQLVHNAVPENLVALSVALSLAALDDFADDEEVSSLAARAVHALAAASDDGKRGLAEAGAASALANVMRAMPRCAAVLEPALSSLGAMAVLDDSRGEAARALRAVARALADNPDRAALQAMGVRCMHMCALAEGSRADLASAGAAAAAARALRLHPDDPELAADALGLIDLSAADATDQSTAGPPNGQQGAVLPTADALDAVLDAMLRHERCGEVQVAGVGALASLAAADAERLLVVAARGGLRLLSRCLDAAAAAGDAGAVRDAVVVMAAVVDNPAAARLAVVGQPLAGPESLPALAELLEELRGNDGEWQSVLVTLQQRLRGLGESLVQRLAETLPPSSNAKHNLAFAGNDHSAQTALASSDAAHGAVLGPTAAHSVALNHAAAEAAAIAAADRAASDALGCVSVDWAAAAAAAAAEAAREATLSRDAEILALREQRNAERVRAEQLEARINVLENELRLRSLPARLSRSLSPPPPGVANSHGGGGHRVAAAAAAAEGPAMEARFLAATTAARNAQAEAALALDQADEMGAIIRRLTAELRLQAQQNSSLRRQLASVAVRGPAIVGEAAEAAAAAAVERAEREKRVLEERCAALQRRVAEMDDSGAYVVSSPQAPTQPARGVVQRAMESNGPSVVIRSALEAFLEERSGIWGAELDDRTPAASAAVDEAAAALCQIYQELAETHGRKREATDCEDPNGAGRTFGAAEGRQAQPPSRAVRHFLQRSGWVGGVNGLTLGDCDIALRQFVPQPLHVGPSAFAAVVLALAQRRYPGHKSNILRQISALTAPEGLAGGASPAATGVFPTATAVQRKRGATRRADSSDEAQAAYSVSPAPPSLTVILDRERRALEAIFEHYATPAARAVPLSRLLQFCRDFAVAPGLLEVESARQLYAEVLGHPEGPPAPQQVSENGLLFAGWLRWLVMTSESCKAPGSGPAEQVRNMLALLRWMDSSGGKQKVCRVRGSAALRAFSASADGRAC